MHTEQSRPTQTHPELTYDERLQIARDMDIMRARLAYMRSEPKWDFETLLSIR